MWRWMGASPRRPAAGSGAGPSPVDRRKGGLKRSVATEDYGIPLGIAAAGANRHDSPLLAPTLQAAATSWAACCPQTAPATWTPATTASPPARPSMSMGFTAQIARKGTPAPIQAGRRWPVERTHSWMNGYGKLRRMTDRDAAIVGFYLYLAAALRHRARTHPARPPPLPLGHPAHHQATQVTHLLPGALSFFRRTPRR